MKKLLSLTMAFLLTLCVFAPRVYAEEAELGEALEQITLTRVSVLSLLADPVYTETAGEQTVVLPEWLIDELLAADETVGDNDTAAALSEAAPSLYEVKNTRRFYNKSGELTYALFLSAVFLWTGKSATALRYGAEYEIYRGSWRIRADQPTVHGETVSALFTVSQLFTGIAIRTDTCTLCVSAFDQARSTVLPGDADLDGRISSADARIALRISVGLTRQTDLLVAVCDLDRDGDVTSADARLILRRAVGLDG